MLKSTKTTLRSQRRKKASTRTSKYTYAEPAFFLNTGNLRSSLVSLLLHEHAVILLLFSILCIILYCEFKSYDSKLQQNSTHRLRSEQTSRERIRVCRYILCSIFLELKLLTVLFRTLCTTCSEKISSTRWIQWQMQYRSTPSLFSYYPRPSRAIARN